MVSNLMPNPVFRGAGQALGQFSIATPKNWGGGDASVFHLPWRYLCKHHHVHFPSNLCPLFGAPELDQSRAHFHALVLGALVRQLFIGEPHLGVADVAEGGCAVRHLEQEGGQEQSSTFHIICLSALPVSVAMVCDFVPSI